MQRDRKIVIVGGTGDPAIMAKAIEIASEHYGVEVVSLEGSGLADMPSVELQRVDLDEVLALGTYAELDTPPDGKARRRERRKLKPKKKFRRH